MFVLMLLMLVSCSDNKISKDISDNDLTQIIERGELRVVTIESALSYYTDGSDEMGFDYDMAVNFSDYIGVPLKLIIVDDVETLKDQLLGGSADFAAYRLPYSKQNKELFDFIDMQYHSQPVVVQPRYAENKVKDVTDLIGREVYVSRKSKYWLRLEHLNAELGGGILIKAVEDSLSIDKLIVEVSEGRIPLTVIDSDIAIIGSTYFKNIDCSVPIGLPQSKRWAVRKDAPLLLDTLNAWYQSIQGSRFYRQLTQQYDGRSSSYFEPFVVAVPVGTISPYDSIFKAAAKRIHWDWRLLAAIAFNESKFNPDAISRVGASGLMQLMPRTAYCYGLDSITIFDPSGNIFAAVEYIKALDNIYKDIPYSDERIKFILASYNAGHGHIQDAMALAKKYGSNPYIWDTNVEKYLLFKDQPEFYNDPVSKYGFFRANHTVRYVNEVFETYKTYVGYTSDK